VPTSCASLWGKCGGKGWKGPTCCPAGSTCVKSHAWYSQCRTDSSPTAMPTMLPTSLLVTPVPSSTGGSDGTCAQLWQQCGGKRWTGPACCVSGSICKVYNPWYSQCRQEE
jgi:hypothetical protein